MDALHIAVMLGNLHQVKSLVENSEDSVSGPIPIDLESESDIQIAGKSCSKGDTPLDCAIKNGQLEIVSYLHKQGAKGGKNGSLERALHLATENKHFETASYVLMNYELDEKFGSETILMFKELEPLIKIYLRPASSGSDGSTQLINRFIYDKFDLSSKRTIGVDFSIKTKDINDVFIKYQFWDAGGFSAYDEMQHLYFRDSIGLVYCIELGSIDFDKIDSNITRAKDCLDNCVIFLVITKTDRSKNSNDYHADIEKLKQKYPDYPILMTSALTGEGVNQAFNVIMQKTLAFYLRKNLGENNIATEPDDLNLQFIETYNKALAGDASAQFQIFQLYYNGSEGVAKNEEIALQWLKKAADGGSFEAILFLAYEQQGFGREFYNFICELEELIKKNQGEDHLMSWIIKSAVEKRPGSEFILGIVFLFGLGNFEIDRKKALSLFKSINILGQYNLLFKFEELEQGNAQYQYEFASLYLDSASRPPDLFTTSEQKSITAAFELLHMAALQGHTESQYMLATMYEEGRGVESCIIKAVEWYAKAAQSGHLNARYKLATICFSYKKDNAEEWLEKSVRQNKTNVLYELADLYVNWGISTPASDDSVEDYQIFNESDAQHWQYYAFVSLGGLHLDERTDLSMQCYGKAAKLLCSMESVIDDDEQEMMIWLKKSADKGNAAAQFMLGKILATTNQHYQNDDQARKYFKLASDNHHQAAQKYLENINVKLQLINRIKASDFAAQHNLAMIYLYGSLVVPRNEMKAFELFNLAADSKYIPSQLILSELYRQGKGVRKSKEKADEWRSKALSQIANGAHYNDAEICYFLGRAYFDGIYIEKNSQLALQHLQLAADLGHKSAGHYLKYLEKSDSGKTTVLRRTSSLPTIKQVVQSRSRSFSIPQYIKSRSSTTVYSIHGAHDTFEYSAAQPDSTGSEQPLKKRIAELESQLAQKHKSLEDAQLSFENLISINQELTAENVHLNRVNNTRVQEQANEAKKNDREKFLAKKILQSDERVREDNNRLSEENLLQKREYEKALELHHEEKVALLKKLEQLQNNLTEAQNKNASLEAENELFKQEKGELSERLVQTINTLASIQDQHLMAQQLIESTRAALQEQITLNEIKDQEAEAEAKSTRENIRILEQRLTFSEAQAAEKAQALDELEKRIQALQQHSTHDEELALLKKKAQQLINEKNQLELENQHLSQLCSELKTRLQTLEDQRVILQQQGETGGHNLTQLKRDLEAARENLKNREHELRTKVKSAEKAEESLRKAKADVEHRMELLNIHLNLFKKHGVTPKEHAFQKFLMEVKRIIPNTQPAILCYFSYAWEDQSNDAGKAANILIQNYLLRLQRDLKTLGIVSSFLDIASMSGDTTACMLKNIEKCNRFLVIGTERMQSRAVNPDTNVGKEWAAIKLRMQDDPNAVIPVLYQGNFTNTPPYTNAFPPGIERNLIRDCRQGDNYYDFMAKLRDPLSFIQALFGIHVNGINENILQDYQNLWEKLQADFKIIDNDEEIALLKLQQSVPSYAAPTISSANHANSNRSSTQKGVNSIWKGKAPLGINKNISQPSSSSSSSSTSTSSSSTSSGHATFK